MEERNEIAVLGTGIMGRAMAEQLLEADFRVRVWNRTADRARPLAERGAEVAETPVDAAVGADAFLTMVTDGDAVRSILDRGDLLAQLEPGTVWFQTSTVGLDDTDSFSNRARTHDIPFVDAPVLGTKEPAEAGELTVLAASDHPVLDGWEELLGTVGSKTIRLGSPPDATGLKLVCNTWVVGILGTLAETIALAEHLEADPTRFLDAIADGPLDSGYAQLKGQMMLSESYGVSFPLQHALKDANLIRRAARETGLEVSVVEGVADLFSRAIDEGHGEFDMAAAIETLRDG